MRGNDTAPVSMSETAAYSWIVKNPKIKDVSEREGGELQVWKSDESGKIIGLLGKDGFER